MYINKTQKCDFPIQIQLFLIAAFRCKASAHGSYVILFYFVSYAMLLCYTMLWLLYCAMLCYAMLCYVLEAGLLQNSEYIIFKNISLV